MSEIKLCKDCKHFIWPESPYEYQFGDPTCRRVVWLVYGSPKTCTFARSDDGECGKDGALHEFDPQPEPKWMNRPPRWFDDPFNAIWWLFCAFTAMVSAFAIYLSFR